MNYNDDNKFNLCLAKINDAYNKNPAKATDIIKKCCDSIDGVKQNKGITITLDEKNKELLALIVCCFMILGLGLFKIEGFGMYFFGWIFFVAGMLVGMYVPAVGIIFLFSHGMTGLCLMLGSLNIKDYVVLISDSPPYVIYLLLGIVVFLLVAGIFFTIMYNFKKYKQKKYYSCYPFLCFFLLILILIFSPNIISFLS